MLGAVHHLALGAADVERLAAFYRDVLQLPELQRHHDAEGLRSVWLGLGEAVLMVERSAAPPRRIDGVGAGLFLLALRASGAARVAAEARLAAAGVTRELRTEHTSYYRDPEGNRVALSDYPT